MQIIDAHHHLWDLETLSYPWLQDDAGNGAEGFMGDITPLRRSYRLADYKRDWGDWNVVKSVHVQAEHDDTDPVAESRWLQAVADADGGYPHAIIAFVDFSRDDVDAVLAKHVAIPNVRGVRQILSHHPNPRYRHADVEHLKDPDWRRRFARLADRGLSFDLQIYPHQAADAVALVDANPDIAFVLNHTCEPWDHGPEGRAAWRAAVDALAARANVAAKISGLGMFIPDWSVDDLRPYVLGTIEAFGVERCMFASNFPVDRLFASFDAIFSAFTDIASDFAESERRALFHDNAARVYRL